MYLSKKSIFASKGFTQIDYNIRTVNNIDKLALLRYDDYSKRTKIIIMKVYG